MKPGLQPISKPPGKVSFGIDVEERREAQNGECGVRAEGTLVKEASESHPFTVHVGNEFTIGVLRPNSRSE